MHDVLPAFQTEKKVGCQSVRPPDDTAHAAFPATRHAIDGPEIMGTVKFPHQNRPGFLTLCYQDMGIRQSQKETPVPSMCFVVICRVLQATRLDVRKGLQQKAPSSLLN